MSVWLHSHSLFNTVPDKAQRTFTFSPIKEITLQWFFSSCSLTLWLRYISVYSKPFVTICAHKERSTFATMKQMNVQQLYKMCCAGKWFTQSLCDAFVKCPEDWGIYTLVTALSSQEGHDASLSTVFWEQPDISNVTLVDIDHSFLAGMTCDLRLTSEGCSLDWLGTCHSVGKLTVCDTVLLKHVPWWNFDALIVLNIARGLSLKTSKLLNHDFNKAQVSFVANHICQTSSTAND